MQESILDTTQSPCTPSNHLAIYVRNWHNIRNQSITSCRLHALIALADIHHLNTTGEWLANDRFEKWMRGPVYKLLESEYPAFDSTELPWLIPGEVVTPEIPVAAMYYLNMVCESHEGDSDDVVVFTAFRWANRLKQREDIRTFTIDW